MLKDLQNHLNQIMHERNNRAVPEFEAYSPKEMTGILYRPFEENSPIEILRMKKTDYAQIPMFNQISYTARLLQQQGELKLTQKGYLPPKVVADLCSKEFLMEDRLSERLKLVKESDSMSATLTRFILHLTGMSKKRNNKLSLTKAGEKLLEDDHQLLLKVLKAYCNRFNWAYFDGYEGEQIGQLGYGFTFILLSKYGDQQRLDRFYAEKYLKAFPRLIDESIQLRFDDVRTNACRAYSSRSFNRFFAYFGLVDIEQKKWGADKFIKKTTLFDKLIKINPPRSMF